MKPRTPIVVVVTLLLCTAPAAAAPLGLGAEAPEVALQQYDTGPSFIVEFEDGSYESLSNWAESSSERKLLRVNNDTNRATVSAPRWQVDAGLLERLSAGQVFANQLQDRSYIESVAPNYVFSRPEPVRPINVSAFETPTEGSFAFDDPAYPTEGVAFDGDAERKNLSAASEATSSTGLANGSSQLIAVVDTGTNTAEGRVFGNGTVGSELRIHNASKNFITGESINASAGDYDAIADGSGHGTWSSAMAVGNPSGGAYDSVANEATLLSLKALDDSGSGSTSDIVAAIEFAASNDADVISLSLGAPIRSQPIVTAVENATEQGSVVVVAAGNSRSTRSPGIATPGDVDSAITVGATNTSGADTAASAYFSQTSGVQGALDGSTSVAREEIDVVAPGMALRAKTPTTSGTVTESTLSGTSMSTPHVASTVAAAMSDNSELADAEPATVHERVTESASPAQNLAVAEAGNGLLNGTNLATDTQPSATQQQAMTDAAEQRQQWYEAASEARGGIWMSLGVA